MSEITRMAQATPSSRDRFVDFLRVASLGGVILGHFLLAVVVGTGEGANRGFDISNIAEWFEWARAGTWVLQVMPVFFVVGGFAHAVSWRSLRARGGGYADFVRARITRLVKPALAFAIIGTVISVVVDAFVDVTGDLAYAFQVSGQLLWFIGIYFIAASLAPAMLRAHEKWGWKALVALVALAATVDILRLAGDVPHVKWLNFAFVWLTIHQLGFFYADGVADRWGKKLAAAMIGLGGVTAALLIALGPYGGSLVSYDGEKLSNLAPPTVVLLCFAVAQAGALLLVRGRLTRWLQGRRPWSAVIAGGALAMTAYLWHFVGLMCMYGILYAAGAPVLGEPGTHTWWLWRLPLFLVFLTIVAVFVVAFRRFDPPPKPAAIVGPAPWRTALAALAAACAVVGMIGYAVVGFRGVLEGFQATAAIMPITSLGAFALVLASALLAWAAARPRR